MAAIYSFSKVLMKDTALSRCRSIGTKDLLIVTRGIFISSLIGTEILWKRRAVSILSSIY